MISCGRFDILGDMTRITIEVFAHVARHPDQASSEWFDLHITAETPEFRAAFDEEIMCWELEDFREGLQRLHTDLSGEIAWKAIEGFLDLEAVMDKLGHIHWSVDLIRHTPSTAILHMKFESDQSYLPALIAQLDAIADTLLQRQ